MKPSRSKRRVVLLAKPMRPSAIWPMVHGRWVTVIFDEDGGVDGSWLSGTHEEYALPNDKETLVLAMDAFFECLDLPGGIEFRTVAVRAKTKRKPPTRRAAKTSRTRPKRR